MADMVELTIQSLSGAELAVLECSASSTVYEVKQRLREISGADLMGQQQLVFGCHALEDCYTLASYGAAGPKATLQCVRLRPSGVALHLEAQRSSLNPEEALSASLSDVADSVMQAEHAQSERHRPCAAHLGRAMTARRRGELVSWMVQAFDALQFTDDILHSTVLTLDRYYARRKTPIQDTSLQKVLLAAVCTEMKLASSTNFPPGNWQRVVAHLCQGRLHLPSILKAEREVLSSLGFVVGVPTPLTFLHGLGLRLEEAASTTEASQWLSSALFLLELALFEPRVQYSYPHAVLAAAALSAALHACGAPVERHQALLEDLSAYCPHVPHLDEAVAACEEELITLWLQSSKSENNLGDFYTRLEAKFSHRSRHGVSRLSPQTALRRLRQTTSPYTTPPSSPASSSSDMVSPDGQAVEKAIAAAAGGA
jgi:hypothetical protein